MRCVSLTAAVLLAFAAPLFAAEKTFEILLARPLPGDTANTWLVILDGGYADGLEEGLTATVFHGPERTEMADITIEIADRHEAFGLAHPRAIINPDTLKKACGEHCLVTFPLSEPDSAAIQQKAIDAMGAADFDRAKYFLTLLIDAGDDRPSIQNALARCDRALAADTAGLPPVLLEAESARLPLYEYLLAHYFGECRFNRTAGIAARIERVSPGHETAGAYRRALRRIESGLADSTAPEISMNPGPVKTDEPVLLKPAEPQLPDSLNYSDPPVRAAVAVLVDETGGVAKATMRNSSGQSTVDNALLNAAYKTVWRPAIQSGRPAAAWGVWDVTLGAAPLQPGSNTPELQTIAADGTDGATPAPDQFVEVDVYPEMVAEQKPKYPRAAEMAGITGVVWVKALVGEKGKVLEAIVGKSSGRFDLDAAAVEAAWKCKYKPALKGGQPVKVWVTYKVSFEIAH